MSLLKLTKSIMYINIKYGIFLGLVLSFISFLLYLWNPVYLLYYKTWIITLMVSLGFMYWAVKKYKEDNSGLANFKDALKINITVLVTSLFTTLIYDILFYNLLVPNYFQVNKTEILAILKDHVSVPLKFLGEDELEIEDLMKKFDSEEDMHLTKLQNQTNSIKGIVFKFLDNLISCLVFSLIVSTFLKNTSKMEGT